jgi:hypothetical protein
VAVGRGRWLTDHVEDARAAIPERLGLQCLERPVLGAAGPQLLQQLLALGLLAGGVAAGLGQASFPRLLLLLQSALPASLGLPEERLGLGRWENELSAKGRVGDAW